MKKVAFLLLVGEILLAQGRGIRVGVYDNPPHTYMKGNSPTGFIVDILRDFANSSNSPIYFEYSTFTGLLDKIRNHQIDILGPIAYSKDRTLYLRYCYEFQFIDWSNLITRRTENLKTLFDLQNRAIGGVQDDYYFSLLKQDLYRQGIISRYRDLGNFRQIIADLESGSIDAGFIGHFTLSYLMRRSEIQKKIQLMPGTFYHDPLYLAVHVNNPEVLTRLDEYLKKQKNDPYSFFHKKYKKWYIESESPFLRFISKNWLPITGIFFGLFGLIAFISFMMNRRVRTITREISRQQSFFQNLFQNIPAGIIILDEKNLVLDMNKEFQNLFGYSLEEIRGKSLDDFISDRSNPEDMQAESEQSLQGIRVDREVTRLSKDKKILYLHLISSPIFIDKIFHGTIAIYLNISERKRMEEQIMKSKNLESIGFLAGGIAHDFNNMLTGILGNISLAKTYSREPEILIILEKAEKATLKTRGLTQQLLTFSKSGMPVKKICSLVEIIYDAVDLILSSGKVQAKVEIREPVPNIEADITQISQVVTNILVNAKDAMSHGGSVDITIYSQEHREDSNFLKKGIYVAACIRDQGPGIHEDILKNLFVPFYTTKQKGMGLGLALSYSILQKHGGNIDIQSQQGEGAAFTIYLPASFQPIPEEVKDDSKIFRRARVLLMDDEEIVREVFRDMLSKSGLDVHLASNSWEAISRYQESLTIGKPFDLVFLDLNSPGDIGGISTLKRLLELDPQVRAIATTGYVTHEVFETPNQYQFLDILQKPFLFDELISMIGRNLKKK